MPAHRRSLLRRPPAAAPAAALFTATAYLNVTTGPHGWPEHHFGYQPGHVLAQVMDPDLPALPLTFVVEAPDPRVAAVKAAAIGRRLTVDKHASYWPLPLRRLAVGDVVVLTPRTPTAGKRRFWALASGGHLTELELVDGTLRTPPPAP
ncbi:hypothetical protein [Kitasatospora sp. NPDC058046]|uniref:hypothetical protein n=1 Tax=Kitasatospora sp. NPDC058046 TaxID=3346312 RepID=UPI0036DB71E9